MGMTTRWLNGLALVAPLAGGAAAADISAPVYTNPFSHSADLTADIARVGVNHQF